MSCPVKPPQNNHVYFWDFNDEPYWHFDLFDRGYLNTTFYIDLDLYPRVIDGGFSDSLAKNTQEKWSHFTPNKRFSSK